MAKSKKKKMSDKTILTTVAILIIVSLLTGISLGRYVFPDEKVIVEQVEIESGKYVRFFDIVHDYFYPYNETDNVSIFITGKHIYINHEIPSFRGMPYFHLGLDEEGYFKYITEWRDKMVELPWLE